PATRITSGTIPVAWNHATVPNGDLKFFYSERTVASPPTAHSTPRRLGATRAWSAMSPTPLTFIDLSPTPMTLIGDVDGVGDRLGPTAPPAPPHRRGLHTDGVRRRCGRRRGGV